MARATKASYDLVEDQEDAVGRGDFGEPFQVPSGGTITPPDDPAMGSTMTAAILVPP